MSQGKIQSAIGFIAEGLVCFFSIDETMGR